MTLSGREEIRAHQGGGGLASARKAYCLRELRKASPEEMHQTNLTGLCPYGRVFNAAAHPLDS